MKINREKEKPVVLMLSTYPFRVPRHGGQVRLFNLAKSYASANWLVKSIAIFEPEAGYSFGSIGKEDIPFPYDSKYRKFKGRNVPLINDLLAGYFAISEAGGYRSVLSKLPKKIDAIHVEQQWLWPLASKISKLRQYKDVCLIYGSQNIEMPLKKEILNNYNINNVTDVLDAIDKLEKRATREADISIGVTKKDLDILIKWGAKRPLLARNGIEPWIPSIKKIDHWQKKLPSVPWVLYIASAHPPNFVGFIKSIGETLGCIPPTSKLVVVGSVCKHLYDEFKKSRFSSLNLSRIKMLGILSDEDLDAVKSLAHAFLLPIPHGGGSNIKTAEALYSGSYVIASKPAMRGFEEFSKYPEVMVARNPKEIGKYIRETLMKPRLNSSVKNRLRQSLSWNKCLASIPDEVDLVLRKRGNK